MKVDENIFCKTSLNAIKKQCLVPYSLSNEKLNPFLFRGLLLFLLNKIKEQKLLKEMEQ